MMRPRVASASAITVALAAVAYLSGYRIYHRDRPTPAASVRAASYGSSVITLPGTYAFADPALTLRVWIDNEQLVQFTLVGSGETLAASATERASALSRWFLLVDSPGHLWFYSGDVGLFAWGGAPDGLTHVVRRDAAEYTNIPAALKERLK